MTSSIAAERLDSRAIRVESLAGRLARHARETPYAMAFRFLTDGETQEDRWTCARLNRAAQRVAHELRERGAAGERVLLLYPPGADYIAAFYGCLAAGAIAVPAYPPEPARLARTLPRLQAIIADCGAAVALTTEPIRDAAEPLLADALAGSRPLQWVATDQLNQPVEATTPDSVVPSDVAFLQYTSGSTTTPRGVMVTHGNLLHNIAAIQQRWGPEEGFSGVCWLPPYHDMGLIGGILAPIHAGLPITLFSPLDFLKHPFRWLQAITRYRGTVSPAPNFAYDLCVRKVTAAQREQLDLRSWRVTFNGAEPVDAAAIDRFVEAFGPCGFRRSVFLPCYGLAEATLIASGTTPESPPGARRLSAAALAQGRAEEAAEVVEARTLISTGRPIEGQRIEIVHPELRRRCGPGEIGEIWLAGPSVARGYWNRPEETAAAFGARLEGEGGGPFLRTGDLGVMLDGELFVTGRIKDLIIMAGQNHYPQDIERSVEASHPAVRRGACAAFAAPIEGHERLVVVAETEQPESSEQADGIRLAIRRAVSDQHQLAPHAVVLLVRGAIPRTSSGKIQRHACRDGYLAGTLETHEG